MSIQAEEAPQFYEDAARLRQEAYDCIGDYIREEFDRRMIEELVKEAGV